MIRMTISAFLVFLLALSVQSAIINNNGIFQPIPPGTDDGLYNEGFFEGDIVPRVDIKNAVANPGYLWPGATVIYRTADDVGCPDSPQCEILMKAIDHYHEKSCVRFKEWTGEENYVEVFFNRDSGACWSLVGRQGDGPQRLSLGQRCWYLGIVIHELGHAVGFWHEMNRPDRDDYIYVYWNNIIPGFSYAFAKRDRASINTLGEYFDFKSIMMYDKYAFSKDGVSPTIATRNGEVIGPIWKKPGLSASDIRRITKLYNCDANKSMNTYPYDIYCNFNKNNCGFKNGGSSVWLWRNYNQTDGYIYSSFESSGTTPGYFLSVNFPKDARPNVVQQGCLRFWYLLQGKGKASLRIIQAYLRKETQLIMDPELTYDLWKNETVKDQWKHVQIPLSTSKPFKLIFNSQFGDQSRNGIIGLDDIQILYHKCSMNSEENQILYPETTSISTTERVRAENQGKTTTKKQISKPSSGVTFLPVPSTPGYLTIRG